MSSTAFAVPHILTLLESHWIYAARDYTKPDASGNGTLTGVEKFSQAEFDEHAQSSKEVQTSSGECVVN